MDRDIYEAIDHATAEGSLVVLATIIGTKGSTPRKAGSKMLIYPDGRIQGTIGGGCGENDVWTAAQDVAASGNPIIVTVDLTDEFAVEQGMVCGGTMEVFVEPIGPRGA